MVRKTVTVGVGLVILLCAAVAYGDGLDAAYGKDLPTIKFKDKDYKVLKTGKLKAGESVEMKKVVFESNAKALAIGIGKGEGSDLDMFVYDAQNGKEIGKDVLLDNVPVVTWQSGAADRKVVNIKLLNSGKGDCEYVLIANW